MRRQWSKQAGCFVWPDTGFLAACQCPGSKPCKCPEGSKGRQERERAKAASQKNGTVRSRKP